MPKECLALRGIMWEMSQAFPFASIGTQVHHTKIPEKTGGTGECSHIPPVYDLFHTRRRALQGGMPASRAHNLNHRISKYDERHENDMIPDQLRLNISLKTVKRGKKEMIPHAS
jgi:hypothetical protein